MPASELSGLICLGGGGDFQESLFREDKNNMNSTQTNFPASTITLQRPYN